MPGDNLRPGCPWPWPCGSGGGGLLLYWGAFEDCCGWLYAGVDDAGDGFPPFRSGSAKAGSESGLKVRLYAILTFLIRLYNRRTWCYCNDEGRRAKMCEVVAPR